MTRSCQHIVDNRNYSWIFCPSCGKDHRQIQGLPRSKQDIAWLVVGLLARGQAYTALEIDCLTTRTIRPNWLTEPAFAADHIRIAMMDASYLMRNGVADSYWVADNFMGPADLENRQAELLRFARELPATNELQACPACGKLIGAHWMFGHCQNSHRLTEYWGPLTEIYCR